MGRGGAAETHRDHLELFYELYRGYNTMIYYKKITG